MRGDADVIKHLNKILKNELTAINQYFCQAKMCKNWGFLKLGKKHYEESLGEMKHAEMLIDRILFLENGRLVEQGTHEELMNLGGRYAELFDLQAASYR